MLGKKQDLGASVQYHPTFVKNKAIFFQMYVGVGKNTEKSLEG